MPGAHPGVVQGLAPTASHCVPRESPRTTRRRSRRYGEAEHGQVQTSSSKDVGVLSRPGERSTGWNQPHLAEQDAELGTLRPCSWSGSRELLSASSCPPHTPPLARAAHRPSPDHGPCLAGLPRFGAATPLPRTSQAAERSPRHPQPAHGRGPLPGEPAHPHPRRRGPGPSRPRAPSRPRGQAHPSRSRPAPRPRSRSRALRWRRWRSRGEGPALNPAPAPLTCPVPAAGGPSAPGAPRGSGPHLLRADPRRAEPSRAGPARSGPAEGRAPGSGRWQREPGARQGPGGRPRVTPAGWAGAEPVKEAAEDGAVSPNPGRRTQPMK